MVEIAIIDNNSKLLNRAKKWINDQADLSCVILESRIGRFFESLDLSHPPDILIMDLYSKRSTNLDHIKKLKILLPGTKFMLYAEQIEEEHLFKALKSGVNAIKLKCGEMQAFLDTVHMLIRGEDYIDPSLSKNIINLFRQEVTYENPAEAHLSQFVGLLNNRELQVVKGLSKGKQYKEIATDLYISINTVRHYIKSIYKKFDVNNKVQLMKKLQGLPNLVH
ncbi:LuxR C-terminal-related transcriptional regulator [Flavilitoribacter nigricans]|uniref:Response regulator transcription factor n=1 Tax=Flavilitoribacter nigricans (strain ATCC 23147 / DSM 23189 / NBRC 102662 / NCIMB 1420 / SS-2) TaxID=1122177 RepID=A0A2D0NEH2_FLAN2|nr:response regulator transcription factor [Flavilitoribacter nigricans]PHN06875.1 hypothetical protein CRP01_09300 [Flavilitoribacter nigricans DSM 23189 = NBRC 102662]